jgi:2-polyprenyl-3-methyl-5-hydroxy-6-metoxy-1,4-benzoquinol methylase
MIIMNPERKCVCNSTVIKEYNKYSQALGHSVEYVQCESCGMITAPGSKNYNLEKIYDKDYFNNIDYGWQGRARILAIYMQYINMWVHIQKMQICDFGAGNGYLSKELMKKGFNILAYEPFVQEETYLDKSYYCNKPFGADVLLMVEVFEHLTNAFEEIHKILSDFNNPKLIIFTTNLTDNAPESVKEWFYLNPDAGHFTIWSKKSLTLLGEKNGYRFISMDDTFLHILCKDSEIKTIKYLSISSIPVKLAVKTRGMIKRLFK